MAAGRYDAVLCDLLTGLFGDVGRTLNALLGASL